MALVFAAPAAAGGPSLVVGAAEDSPKQATLDGAKTHMTMAKLAGLKAIRVTTLWRPGLTEPPAAELTALKNAAAAGNLAGIRLVVSVYPFGSSVTPLTPEARTQFARFTAAVASAGFRELIIGNEPNINRFWLPQFAPDGSNAAATAFLPLLAETYDAVKAAEPRAFVWGIGLSPRGSDNPALSRPTHSPTAFIRDLGTAYRRSGRKRPLMDGFAFHPYMQASRVSPTQAHPQNRSITIADYPKLVALLNEAFGGTAQPGARLPIYYTEFGVQTNVPPSKRALYSDFESPERSDSVGFATQAAYYRTAIQLAYCQPTVRGLFLFHTFDEADLGGWQSGLYFPDRTPKPSLPAFKKAVADLRNGRLPRCPR
jgi:hypothetical protein